MKTIKKITIKILLVLSLMFVWALNNMQHYYLSNYNLLAKENNLQILNQNERNNSYEYVIDKYDVNIVVNENNTFDIIETIDVYFNVEKHGIYRNIPLKNKIVRLDGTSSSNKALISNLDVNSEYESTKENGYLKLKIGSSDITLTGNKQYIIKYNYNIGKDPIKDYDEFYFNIIGNEWDTIINNVTFSITMPKEFDTSKVGFSSGNDSFENNSNILYTINDNKIEGKYEGVLGVSTALTIRCILPEGYFVNANIKTNIIYSIMYVIPLLFLIISIFLWFKFGRDEKIEETSTYYPPEGFNSLEIGYLYKGRAETQDVVSLLLYLANKGYIKILKLDEKSKDFKIVKLKDYDGNNENEKLFLDGLFANTTNEVTSLDLKNNFYITINKILANVNSKENKYKIFEKSASSKLIFVILMIIATFIIITIPPIFSYGDTSLLIFAILCPGLGFTLMFAFLFTTNKTIYINGKVKNSSLAVKIFGIVWGLMFGGIPFAIMVLPSLLQDVTYLIGYIIGVICVLGMTICLTFLPKRTPYGNEILSKIKGFKKYLEMSSKEELEIILNQNPTYFYELLPYSYVLGVSNEWTKKFENMVCKAPIWYDSNNAAFNMNTFYIFMNNTMDRANDTMTSSPSSSSSSSAGGFSGGGSGGGGGSSW